MWLDDLQGAGQLKAWDLVGTAPPVRHWSGGGRLKCPESIYWVGELAWEGALLPWGQEPCCQS